MIIRFESISRAFLFTSYSILVLFPTLVGASSFPETIEERKREERGSIIGDEGLQFKLSHGQNKTAIPIIGKSSLSPSRNNNYLWLAALENVKSMPLNSADYNGGIIITDWITEGPRLTHRYKISIHIKDKAINLDSFEVNVYGEEFKRGRWMPDQIKPDFLKTKITNDILARAKELQAKSKRK